MGEADEREEPIDLLEERRGVGRELAEERRGELRDAVDVSDKYLGRLVGDELCVVEEDREEEPSCRDEGVDPGNVRRGEERAEGSLRSMESLWKRSKREVLWTADSSAARASSSGTVEKASGWVSPAIPARMR